MGPDKDMKCLSCEYGQVIEGVNSSNTRVFCGQLHPTSELKKKVLWCTEYHARGSKGKWDYEKIAWILEVSKGKPIGFISPLEAKKKGLTED